MPAPLLAARNYAAERWHELTELFRPGVPRSFRNPVESRPAVQIRLASADMRPRDRLLMFIALDGAPRGLDPIRLQKGLFLYAMANDSDADDVYRFVPYNYGPMSAQIYRDLEALLDDGLIDAEPVEGQSWARYIASERGLSAARALLRTEQSHSAARRLYEIKVEVVSHTYQEVLEDVYQRFPEFASKSVFRRAS